MLERKDKGCKRKESVWGQGTVGGGRRRQGGVVQRAGRDRQKGKWGSNWQGCRRERRMRERDLSSKAGRRKFLEGRSWARRAWASRAKEKVAS